MPLRNQTGSALSAASSSTSLTGDPYTSLSLSARDAAFFPRFFAQATGATGGAVNLYLDSVAATSGVNFYLQGSDVVGGPGGFSRGGLDVMPLLPSEKRRCPKICLPFGELRYSN